MTTARKYAFNNNSMSRESRSRAYAAINILWNQMRPDLRFEAKSDVRDERLAWIASFLGLKKLDSTTKLTDGQIGKVLDEMKRMTGQASTKKPESNTKFQFFNNSIISKNAPSDGAEVIHLATEAQQFTARKLFDFLGWSVERKEEFLRDRFNCPNVPMLTFKKANALLMILLNTAAHVDLKAKGKKTGRAETAKHIPILKKKLQIDR